jgi:hypothetical protein
MGQEEMKQTDLPFSDQCPRCDKQLYFSFGDDVDCDKCNKTWETGWEEWPGGHREAWIINQDMVDELKGQNKTKKEQINASKT